GFELQRNNTRYNDNCQEAYIANAPGSSPSPNPLNLLALQLSCGLFPAAPPLVYSDKESAANAPQPPRIFQWIPHSPQRSPESKRAPPRPAKRSPSPTIAPANPTRSQIGRASCRERE